MCDLFIQNLFLLHVCIPIKFADFDRRHFFPITELLLLIGIDYNFKIIVQLKYVVLNYKFFCRLSELKRFRVSLTVRRSTGFVFRGTGCHSNAGNLLS
jgi:hypothetical protein